LSLGRTALAGIDDAERSARVTVKEDGAVMVISFG
jgi:hypothetical protein